MVLFQKNFKDKRALYLINTTEKGALIYELVAASSAERTQLSFIVDLLVFCWGFFPGTLWLHRSFSRGI